MILFLTAGLSYGQSAAMKHLTKGVDYAAQGKFKDAKEEFGKVSKADPLYTSIEEDLKGKSEKKKFLPPPSANRL